MELYFLDDGSLIIDKHTSITLINSEQFEIVRTIGCNQFSGLSGKEAYEILIEKHFPNSDVANRKDKCRVREDKCILR